MLAQRYEFEGASFVGVVGWETDFGKLVETHQAAGDV